MKDLITKKVSTFCGLKISFSLENKGINDFVKFLRKYGL